MQINSEPWYIILYPMEAGSTLTGCPSRPAIWLAIILYPMEAGSTLTGYHKANMFQFNLPQEEAYGSLLCPFNWEVFKA